MIEELRTRALWIERNILPFEPDIRMWLRLKRIRSTEIDDVIQEMYAKLSSLSSFDNIRNPHRYALAVAQSVVFDSIRRDQRNSETAVENIETLNNASEDLSPEELMAMRDEIRQVEQLLTALPERTRDVFVLRRIKGLSQRETAERLSIAEKTVEKHLSRAVMMLIEQFGRGGKSVFRTSFRQKPRVYDSESDES